MIRGIQGPMAVLVQCVREAGWAPAGVLGLLPVFIVAGAGEPLFWLLHFLGGAAVAFFFHCAASLCAPLLGNLHPLGRKLMAFGLACAAALLWEFAEFALDATLGWHLQRDLPDTMIDLILGAAGACTLLAWVWIAESPRRATAGERQARSP